MSTTTQATHRIRKRRTAGWAIERRIPAGTCERGPRAGQPRGERWVQVRGAPTVAYAAQGMLDAELAARWPKPGWTGEDLTRELVAATEAVREAVREAVEGMNP